MPRSVFVQFDCLPLMAEEPGPDVTLRSGLFRFLGTLPSRLPFGRGTSIESPTEPPLWFYADSWGHRGTIHTCRPDHEIGPVS